MSFERHQNCTGCGLCSLITKKNVQMKWDNGFLYPNAITDDIPSQLTCPLWNNIEFKEIIESFVGHHKILESRMDGSAGGVYSAILETAAKESAYLTGTVYDEELKVHHVITKDPEQIKSFCGYKPTESNPYKLFPKIKDLLEKGETVVFGGLPCQCQALYVFLEKDYPLLFVIDFVCNGQISQDLIDLYASELEKQEKTPVTNIRYYNKEFPGVDSKRISFKNGKMIFTQTTDIIDKLMYSGAFTRKECKVCKFSSLTKRIGDITIGSYDTKNVSHENLGQSYISVNTNKGKNLFEKSKRRIEIVEDNKVQIDRVLHKTIPLCKKEYLIKKEDSLKTIYDSLFPVSFIQKIKHNVGYLRLVLITLRKTSRLHFKPLFQFVKLNFFTKGIKTNYYRNGFIYITPHCEFLIDKNASIVLNGPLLIGRKRVPTSKLETRLRMMSNSKLFVNGKTDIGNGSNIEIYNNATLEIGSAFSNAPIVIICGEHIKLGNPVNIARGVTIRDTNGHLIAMKGFKTKRPVEIGNHVWICSDSTIMPGVQIGDGAIVGACSYIVQNVAPFTLVQGNPATTKGTSNYFVM